MLSVCRQINCVGGITCGPRACSKSFLAVKPVTPVLFISYTLMDEKEAEKKRSLRNEKLKANRTSETEEQRKERLRIRREKDRARRRN